MTTSKSPRKVLKLAHDLARQALPDYGNRFSRHDFTNAQLFACLVLREHQRKSFRGVEALLRDSPTWLADVGLSKPPDHNTLCRAFDRFVGPQLAWTILDLMAQLAAPTRAKASKRRDGRRKPLAVDSSMFESRHVSRHFERRRRDTSAAGRAKKAPAAGANRSTANAAASSAACPSSRWRATARRT